MSETSKATLDAILQSPELLQHLGQRVRIWSDEHGAYWRPNAAGYTADGLQAGIYHTEQAFRRVRHCGPEKRIVLIAAQPDTWEQEKAELVEDRDSWRRAAERLVQEESELVQALEIHRSDLLKAYTQVSAQQASELGAVIDGMTALLRKHRPDAGENQ